MKKVLFFICIIFILNELNAQTLYFESTYYDYELLKWVDSAIIADLNGDELPDFIVFWQSQKKLYIGLNDGLGKPNFTLIDEGSDIRQLTTADIDSDGDLDFIGTAPFEDASFWWENDGNTNFTKHSLPIKAYDCIHFADLNGDKQLEAIIGIDDALHIYNYEKGTFTHHSTLFESSFGANAQAIQTFDNDRDGLLDIVAVFDRDGIIIFQQTAALFAGSIFESIIVESELYNQSSLFITDINQDKATDFITHSTFNGNASIIMNNNDGTYTTSTLPKDLEDNEFTTLGDIDNDGDDDLLYLESTFPNSVLAILINEEGKWIKQELSNHIYNIGIASILDFNNDGDKEIVVFSNSGHRAFVVFEHVDSILSTVSEYNAFPLAVFPTLVSDFLKIETDQAFTYFVMDAYGRKIIEGKGIQGTTIDCRDWNNGMYFITVNQEESSTTRQVVKATE